MLSIRPIRENDRTWMKTLWNAWWSALFIVSKDGLVHHIDDVHGFIGEKNGKRIGLLTYVIVQDECEITSMHSLEEGTGVGTQLLHQVEETAKAAGCHRIWVITTNDNLQALRFYQKRGYHLVAIYRDAMKDVRELKPDLPLLGIDDIPLRDMIELEKIL